ncbi:hypothetical protein BDW72DRAFT_199745 [Aspergillus terricola var. indicus]
MKLAPAAFISAGAMLGLVQQAPAPVHAVVMAIYGGVAAGTMSQLVSNVAKRDAYAAFSHLVKQRSDDPFAGLPQPAANQCKEQLSEVTVTFAPAGDDGVRIDGVPSTCMTLATVFLGENPGQPAPIPMGSASLEYRGLSADQLNQLKVALDAQ